MRGGGTSFYDVSMYYPDWYKNVSASFRSEMAEQAILILDRALVGFIALAYVVATIFLLATGDTLKAVRMIVVPGLTFALVTYLRNRWNAPRPYELYDIDPIIPKATQGKSMPSRHISSAVIIACALAWLHMDWGVLAFAASAVLAFTRIVGGVHFPRDVAVAAAISLVCGIIGFVIIPS